MGDSHNDTVRVDFERQIKLECHGSTVTSDAGLLVGCRAKDGTAASTREMARFETEILSTKENFKHLMDLSAGGSTKPTSIANSASSSWTWTAQ